MLFLRENKCTTERLGEQLDVLVDGDDGVDGVQGQLLQRGAAVARGQERLGRRHDVRGEVEVPSGSCDYCAAALSKEEFTCN